ncbi:MAG: LLM class flavin-dependent oxidoreductase [Acidimicrobiia bacterium]
MSSTRIKVGIRPPHEVLESGAETLRSVIGKIEALGIDHVCVGDHVTFKGGRGYDGLVQSTAIGAVSTSIDVHTAVYLLPLRHPVPVARQVMSLAQLTGGRFVFGIGLGGDDRTEYLACGVDPATRGKRMDESLDLVRRLMTGAPVTHQGRFFELNDVTMVPVPERPVPIVVGGRADATVHRVARNGDGWLGVFVSAQRFTQMTAQITDAAAAIGRTEVDWRHGVHIWCGFGASAEAAQPALAEVLEGLYRQPFSNFERYAPHGTPDDVAGALAPFVEAGCRSFNLSPVSRDLDEALESVAAVRTLLNA